MAEQKEQAEAGRPGQQRPDSRQSAQQGEEKAQTGKPPQSGQEAKGGIGSSQGQDRGSPDEQQEGRPSAGTPDIERGDAAPGTDRGAGSQDSMVNDMTGAFKERP